MTCTIGFNQAQTEALTTVASNAVIGFVAAALYTPVLPIAGAVFGAFSGLTFSLIEMSTSCLDDSFFGKIARVALTLIASIVIGAAATTALGYSLTYDAALVLTLTMAATTILLNMIFRCCFRMNHN